VQRADYFHKLLMFLQRAGLVEVEQLFVFKMVTLSRIRAWNAGSASSLTWNGRA
jgi:hypothetical protein